MQSNTFEASWLQLQAPLLAKPLVFSVLFLSHDQTTITSCFLFEKTVTCPDNPPLCCECTPIPIEEKLQSPYLCTSSRTTKHYFPIDFHAVYYINI